MASIVRAVHTFVAEHGDELEFQAGELIHVLERDDGFGDGWWRGRNARGDEGLFPATYISEQIEPASDGNPVGTVEETRQLESPDIPNKAKPERTIVDPPKAATTPPSLTSGRGIPIESATEPTIAESIPQIEPAEQYDHQTSHTVNNAGTNGDTDANDLHTDKRIRGMSVDDSDLTIGLDTRARLAEQAKLANEQRDRSRMSGGVTGLVYSDESEDEDELHHIARSRSGDDGLQTSGSQGDATRQIGSGLPSSHTPSLRAASLGEKDLQPALPIPGTPPLAVPTTGTSALSMPKTWSIDHVVAWLQDRGFDEATCSKFKDHEITGDVLLEMDVNLLKELDIPQLGKRMRIAQAIADLRSQSGSPSPPVVADQPQNGSATPAGLTAMSTPSTSALAEAIPFSAWAHSRRTSSTTPTLPSMEAIREGQTNPPSVPSMPTTPVTPNSSLTKRESVGSSGHRKGKASIDNKDRLSFFGRARKPPPVAGSPGEPKISRLSSSNGRTHQMQPTTFDQSSKAPAALSGSAAALRQIGVPDHSGYMKKKGERYGTWKTRFFVLKGSHLYYMKSEQEDRVKGNIDLRGYRVIVDENTNPGSYGFRLTGNDKSHAFSSSEQTTIREWMKALMKATIARDYTVPVSSSCNIPTIPLAEAQALAPRPPSPATRDATQRATRRENTNQLTAHDASVLMSLDTSRRASQTMTPSRPSRHNQRPSVPERPMSTNSSSEDPKLRELVDWVNNRLPAAYPRASSLPGSFVSGEVLFLLVRSLSGVESSPPVPPSAFHPENGLPGLSGLFAMMDIMIDAGIDTAGVSINDVRQGDAESIQRLVESVRLWDEQRSGLAR